jgi:hypothetical protein
MHCVGPSCQSAKHSGLAPLLDTVHSTSIIAVRSAQASTADENTCTFAHAVMLWAVSVLYAVCAIACVTLP